MKRSKKAISGAAAVAAGPSGLRRLLGGCLTIVLLGGLGLAALTTLATWLATNGGDDRGGDGVLPCPPETVAIAYVPHDLPETIRKAVEGALEDAGRIPVMGGYGEGQSRDLQVSHWPTTLDPRPPMASGRLFPDLRLETIPTRQEVAAALGERLSPCEPVVPVTEEEHPEQYSVNPSWPWARSWTSGSVVGVGVAGWWLAGPQLVRGVVLVLWPLRLAARRWQRWEYRRSLASGSLSTEWPMEVELGQLWHENPEAMRDRRTPRQQHAENEPERRQALRMCIREERLRGDGIMPARLWQLVYRTDADEGPIKTKGAPKKEGVSQ